MTTIAWDGRTLAADSRNTVGGMPFTGIKAYRLSDGRLYAGSGSAEDCEAVLQWLETRGDKPNVKDFAAIVIASEKCFRLEDKLVLIPVLTRFHAVGSGRDYAIAAMAMGKTAQEAVLLACRFDIYSGPPVIELRQKSSLTVVRNA